MRGWAAPPHPGINRVTPPGSQSSLRMEGFILPKCVEADCDRDSQTRCRDCSFGAYYCMECCNELHRIKHQFHSPEVLKVSVSRGFFSDTQN